MNVVDQLNESDILNDNNNNNNNNQEPYSTESPQDQTDPESTLFSTTLNDVKIKVPQQPIIGGQGNKNVSFSLDFLETKKPINLHPKIPYTKQKSAFTAEEISQTADKVIAGKPVSIMDVIFLVEVIEELNSRRIEFLVSNEYLKAQNIIEKAATLREQFRITETAKAYSHQLEDLQKKKQEVENSLAQNKQESKEKLKQLRATHKAQIQELQEKQNIKRANLENEWQTPQKQRIFTKQSPELLQKRMIQMKSVLVGELVYADKLKKENQKQEKIETQQKYNELTKAFEAAREKQELEFIDQINDLQKDQELEIEKARIDSAEELTKLNYKIQLINSLIQEEKMISHKQKGSAVMRKTSDLPLIEKTSQNIQAKNAFKMQASSAEPKPLQLPPLVIKKRKFKSQLK